MAAKMKKMFSKGSAQKVAAFMGGKSGMPGKGAKAPSPAQMGDSDIDDPIVKKPKGKVKA